MATVGVKGLKVKR